MRYIELMMGTERVLITMQAKAATAGVSTSSRQDEDMFAQHSQGRAWRDKGCMKGSQLTRQASGREGQSGPSHDVG